MKTSSLIAAALPGLAFGAAIQRDSSARQVQSPQYLVTDFSANCIPHSSSCALSFNVALSPNTSPINCGFFGPGPNEIPDIALTGCADAAYSFRFETATDGAGHGLTVVSTISVDRNITGTYTIPSQDIVLEDHGSVATERYVGSGTFVISPLTSIPL